MLPRVRFVLTMASALGLSMVCPRPAMAANCAATPVLPTYPEPSCLQIVDRSSDAVLHLEYSYPPEQLELIRPENPQTVQFFAFRVKPEVLPNWLTEAELETVRQEFEGTDCYPEQVSPEQVLETNESLEGQWFPISPEAVPVTAEQATEGVDWDTTGLSQGTYYVFAYTYAGRFNGWSMYPGVVKVLDAPDQLDAVPPTIFIEDLPVLEDSDYYPGQKYTLRGCAHAMAGSEYDVSWQMYQVNEDPSWQPMAQCMPLEGGSVELEVPFIMPHETTGESIQFRGVIEDPMNRVTEITTSFRLMGPDTEACEDAIVKPDYCEDYEPGDPDSIPEMNECEPGEGDTGTTMPDGDSTTDPSGTTDPTDTTGAGGTGGGGGCSIGHAPVSTPAALLGLLALGWRRRRD